jgi:spermidine synthase
VDTPSRPASNPTESTAPSLLHPQAPTNSQGRKPALLYGLFALSGFAGLIFESIWSHYLKLFLGHAAYAQTLVLVIFMGGMSIGAWLVSTRSQRLRNPLLAYCVVEALLGVAAFAFDPLFRAVQTLMFDSIVPHLPAGYWIDLCKWCLAGLMLLPQSILLGATFPLISAGALRLGGGQPGRAIGWLYFTNSLGASAGVLVSGFYLIGKVGLPGTIAAAGLVNVALALTVWLGFVRTARTSETASQRADIPFTRAGGGPPRLLIAAAFLTGAASFCYEIGWLRMLALVLGSATHSFELMLAAFIFCLSAGSFHIRNRIERQADALRTLGWIQLAMATAAFLTIPLYNESFYWMGAIVDGVQRDDTGYVLFTWLSQGICVALMFPATFLAGMTLPLITASLLRSGHGEASIGRVYAANTVGSICGVLVAVHVVMPYFGLRQVIVAGAAVDLALGLWLLARRPPLAWTRPAIAAALLTAGSIALLVPFDPLKMASSVFRNGTARLSGDEARVVFHRDGKTASVDVVRHADGGLSIATNGKVDARINYGNIPSSDEFTMTLLAALPLMAKPDATRAAAIGMGSGSTAQNLLLSPHLQQLDTIEIEPAIAEGARQFGTASHLVFEDPRSRIRIEDAKTYFARNIQSYDIIVSEPSNPWVSGVSSLFSVEFYRQIKRRIAAGGVFVQWLQLYEIGTPTVALAMNALGDQFDDYALYTTTGADALVLASPHGPCPPLSDWVFASPGLQSALQRIDVRGPQDMQSRRIGTKRTLAPFFRRMQSATNSDFFPVLDQAAAKGRFLKSNALEMNDIVPVSSRLDGENPAAGDITLGPFFDNAAHAQPMSRVIDREQAQVIAAHFVWRWGKGVEPDRPIRLGALQSLITLRALNDRCDPQMLLGVWLPAFQQFTIQFLPYFTPAESEQIASILKAENCYQSAPQVIQVWIALFEADGAQDWPAVGAIAQTLLDSKPESGAALDFIQQELLLASLKTGGPPLARSQLVKIGRLNLESIPLFYLAAQIAGP